MDVETRGADLQEAIDLVEKLTEALRRRSSTACAKGILMERYGVGREAAHSLLVGLAADSNTTLERVAERIIGGEPLTALRAPQPRSTD